MYGCNPCESQYQPSVSYDAGAAIMPQEQYAVSMPEMQESWMQETDTVAPTYSFNPVSYAPQPMDAYQSISPDALSEAIEAELRELDG